MILLVKSRYIGFRCQPAETATDGAKLPPDLEPIALPQEVLEHMALRDG